MFQHLTVGTRIKTEHTVCDVQQLNYMVKNKTWREKKHFSQQSSFVHPGWCAEIYKQENPKEQIKYNEEKKSKTSNMG